MKKCLKSAIVIISCLIASTSIFKIKAYETYNSFSNCKSNILSMGAYDRNYDTNDDAVVNVFDAIRFNQSELSSNDYAKPYSDLKGVAFGCSLTARGIENSAEYPAGEYFGYLRELQKVSGILFENKGIGGYCFYNPTADSIYKRIISYDNYTDMDIVVIEGDFNGWNTEKALGTYKDVKADTTCGCMYNAIKFIKSKNPNIKIFVILDHFGKKMNDKWNGTSTEIRNGLTQQEYYSELKKVCEANNVECIALYEMSNINEFNPEYISDFIHLNAWGEIYAGRLIYSKMIEMLQSKL